MTDSETQIGSADWNLAEISLNSCRRVRMLKGRLKGLEGTVVLRTDVHSGDQGRVLVQLQRGVFVEIDAACLENID